MSFLGRTSFLVGYLTSKALVIFEANNKQSLMFLPAYIQYGEITDEKKYQEELQKFLQKLKLKGKKGILVLSHELVFFKEVPAPYRNEKEETENFLKTVPLVKTNLAVIAPHNARKLQMLAADRKLYGEITEAFKKKGIEISSVVPASVLNIDQAQELTVEETKNILKEKKIIERYNFLQSKQNLELDTASEQAEFRELAEAKINMRKQYIFLTFALILLASAIGYFLLWSEIIPNFWFKQPSTLKETPTAVASVTPEPSSAEEKQMMDKSSITIQVLNGSGIEGQAEEINSLLQNAGYKNIITGNATSSELITKIMYKKQVPKEISDNITETVEKTLPKVTILEASQSAEFDVVIATGNK